MSRFALAGLMLAMGAALVLGWGYGYASGHANLLISIDDRALHTVRMASGAPHDVTIAFRDASQRPLAQARSVEPQGYVMALHPDAAVGNCQQHRTQPEHSQCEARYSAWLAGWAAEVREADVTVGTCTLRGVPVAVRESNDEWILWWVPLPHVGGLPRRHVSLSLAIDTARCP